MKVGDWVRPSAVGRRYDRGQWGEVVTEVSLRGTVRVRNLLDGVARLVEAREWEVIKTAEERVAEELMGDE